MKKVTLFLVATLFSALSFAALNPFAYGLESQLSDDKGTVTLTYSLNADATSVNIVILDGETEVKTIACDGKTAKGTHSLDVLTNGFPKGKTLSWKVEVKGAEVSSYAIHDVKYNAYHPSSVDIDNNPESPYFGRILCNEGMQKVQGLTKSSNAATNGKNYLGTEMGAGIYEFNAAFEYIGGYNGGKTFPINRYGVTGTNSANQAYVPRRIRISDDGRIFVTSLNSEGDVLWELNPKNLNEWTTVIADGTRSTVTKETRNIVDANGNFIAGPNVGFDVYGSGENLKLVMLSSADEGWASTQSAFKCAEYNLGTAKSWNKQPSKIIFKNLALYPMYAQVQYDKDGGVWFIQYYGTTNNTTKPGLAHWNVNNTDQTPDYIARRDNSRNAGFRYNRDYSKVIIAGTTSKHATIYDVTIDTNGVPQLSNAVDVDMTTIGNNLNDFAWDYADNIYVVGSSNEFIAAYPSPHSADKVVSTPCRTDEAIVIPADPQLNPFAYNLTSELSADEKDLTVNYSLNAPATSVEWVLMDGTTEVKRVDLSSFSLAKGDHTTTISTTDFPQYKQLTWKIEVKGVAVGEPTLYDKENAYHPSSVDIDNNPESKYFGRILCNEGMQKVKGRTKSDGSKYLGTDMGAGIFEFNAAFEYQGGYNGGKTFPINRYGVTGTASANQAYVPRRIRISEDGRIFVTSLNSEGDVLWELNPENLNEWNTVIADGTRSTVTYEKRNIIDKNGNFIAGPNVGFDVHGSGENLKLLMLSSADEGWSYNQSAYKCVEYDLGTNTSWNKVPSRTIFNKLAVYPLQAQVQYDKNGGVWFTQHNSNTNQTTLPGLAHWDANSTTPDVIVKRNNVQNSGFRYNHDFTKVIIAGIEDQIVNSKKATVYSVSEDATGKPVLTKDFEIDMNILGNNINDFAWDYANNIYAVSNSNEYIAVWAMPHSNEDVVATPAASKYAFSIGKYTVTVNTNDVNKGTVTGGGEYGAGAVVTLTATPKEGYELLYWSDRSKENPRNITVDGNEALSAYFIKKNDVEPTFSITKVWENTNVPDSYTKGYQAAGWDGKIYVKDRYGAAINVYTEIGSELYVSTDGLTTETAHRGDQALAIDNAGNIVIRSGSGEFFNNPTQITIYKKGEKTGKVIDFTLLETGRCDFISASGDIFSAEGGYVYFYCQNKTAVNRVKITNGAVADIDVVGGDIPVGVTQNHVIQDIFGNLVAHSRTNGIKALNVITNEASNFYILPNTLKTTTLGGCSFELSGKELWAYNVGTTAYTSEWNLYNVTNTTNISNEVLYVKDKTSVGTAANWLNVQVVDEKTAYIYQFCPQVGAAVWKVTRDHIVTATAENGTVEGAGTYKDNATATLTATANDGYLFKNWTTKNGAVVSTDNPYSFTVTEDVELVANFDGPFCELILNTNDEEKGTVSGAGFYNVGQTVTIKATPKAGYKLLYWSDRSTQATRTITMNKKEALSAYFVKVYDEEPTFAIEKVWENTNVPGSADGYQAVGWDGKIYMQNKTAGQIQVFYNGTDAAANYAASNTSGQQIAIDEAGNLIVFNATFYSATPNAIQIYQKGSTTAKAINFTLPNPGRCDFLSASGDIYSAEGGYVYFYCNTQTVVNRVKITNGAVTASDVTIDVVGSNISTANSTSHIMVDIFGNLLAHARSNNNLYAINVLTDDSKLFVLPSHKYSTLGGCSFELGGKELWAYNVGTTNYNSEWNLYNMTDGEFLSNETLYAKDKVSKKTYGAANWLNVQVVDEETAYIYQFCPEVAVAVWKVSLINTVVIDDKAVNSTALAEYNGQKVTAKVTRAFSNDSYKTLTLPFDMDEEQIKAVFGETAIVHEFTSVGEENDMFYLHFDPTTTIEAGKPYIIQLPKPGEGDYDAKDGFTIENVTIKTDLHSVQPAAGAITMQPILDGGGRLTQASEYWLASDNHLYSAGAHPTALLGLRAYFINSTGRPIRARVVYGENEATSIPTIVAPEDNVRKVLKDGQIIIIRGEKQYNIQGQVIE